MKEISPAGLDDARAHAQSPQPPPNNRIVLPGIQSVAYLVFLDIFKPGGEVVPQLRQNAVERMFPPLLHLGACHLFI